MFNFIHQYQFILKIIYNSLSRRKTFTYSRWPPAGWNKLMQETNPVICAAGRPQRFLCIAEMRWKLCKTTEIAEKRYTDTWNMVIHREESRVECSAFSTQLFHNASGYFSSHSQSALSTHMPRNSCSGNTINLHRFMREIHAVEAVT